MSADGNLKQSSLQLPTSNGISVPTTAPQKLSSSGSATGNPRNKCALKPGHSLMDWIRLGNSGVDLAGTSGRVMPVSIDELAKHAQQNDAWMAIRGKVFNVTRYMDFHPGGVDELMRGVGRDATKLFEEVHAWVNYPQLLGKCYIGPLKYDVTAKTENDLRKSLLVKTASDFSKPPLPMSTNADIVPRFDCIQNRTELTMYIYTRQFANPGLILKHKSATALLLQVQIMHLWHEFDFELQHDVAWPPKNIKIGAETGKIEIILTKITPEPWSTYGAHKATKLPEYTLNDEHYDFEVASKVKFNHDSFELRLRSVHKDTIFVVPFGFHIPIEDSVNGVAIQRSYTPVHTKFLNNVNKSTNSHELNFLIKTYENGLLSAHLAQLTTGAILQLSVPRGNFKLQALAAHRNILFLAAGSGLTPFLNLIEPLLKRNANRLECLQLMYFNKTVQDIWARDTLSSIATADERFCYDHILSQADDCWNDTRGRLRKDLLAPLLSRNKFDAFGFVAICGPDAFNTLAVELLKEFDFKTEKIHMFQG